MYLQVLPATTAKWELTFAKATPVFTEAPASLWTTAMNVLGAQWVSKQYRYRILSVKGPL